MITLDPRGTTRTIRFYVLYGLAILISELIGYTTFYGVSTSSVIWPCAGVYGGLLAVTHRRHWASMIIILILIDQIVFQVMRDPLGSRIGTVILFIKLIHNPLSGVFFALVIQSFIRERNPIGDMRALGVYAGVAVFANMVCLAFVLWSVATLFSDEIHLTNRVLQWSYSGISGLLAYATPIIVIANRCGERSPVIKHKREAPLYLAALILVCVFLFVTTSGATYVYLYQYLILIILLAWAIARFGVVMLTIASSVLLTIIIIGISMERGPFHVADRPPVENVLIAQGFIVPSLLTILFVASLLDNIRVQYEQRLATEKQLRQAERALSLGTMANGVAHDFGNLTMALRSYLSVLRAHIKGEDERVRNAVDGIGEIAEGAHTLTSTLLMYAREDAHDLRNDYRVSDLCAGVEASREVIDQFHRKGHKISIRVPDSPAWVNASRNDITRLMENLVLNALDASTPGSPIDIKLYTTDSHAKLTVSDHGKGIPPEHLPHVTDPFFTTKTRGKGTGLGLSIVSTIVRDADGKLELDSMPGVGTSVTITFPIVDEPCTQTDASDAS